MHPVAPTWTIGRPPRRRPPSQMHPVAPTWTIARPCRRHGTSSERVNVLPYVRLLALILAALPLGHSVNGRTMQPILLGSAAAEHRVLVVGCIHGTERAGITIARRLV